MVIFMVMKPRSKELPATISAAEFKARCLDLMDVVAATGSSVTVTKRGKPVAVLAPVAPERGVLRGSMKGRMRVVDREDDLFSTGAVWDVAR